VPVLSLKSLNFQLPMVILALMSLTGSGASAQIRTDGKQPSRSIRDGVFSSDQAGRGEQQYQLHCSDGCHMKELTGSGLAPPLAGDTFIQHWRGMSLNDLFTKVRTTMPLTSPHSLGDGVYIDIVAFLLDANGFPSGSTDLAADETALASIGF
jgi:hypothetical protein